MAHPRPRRAAASLGFTLVELMVVIVILGSLIALVGPDVWNALFQSRVDVAKAQMSNFSRSIEMYRISRKKLPQSLDALTEGDDNERPIMEEIPPDPWDNPYEYKVLGRDKYQIRSAGDDGQVGTEDDIVWPQEKD